MGKGDLFVIQIMIATTLLVLSWIMIPIPAHVTIETNVEQGDASFAIVYDGEVFTCNMCNPLIFGQKINLNTASVSQLEKLPYIGKRRAHKIVEYRETKGEFSSIMELTKVNGIGTKTIEKIADYSIVQ